MKIFMIADDSPVIRKVARRILEGFGIVVVEAEDGTHAQQLCMENMPDGILVDWSMPGLDGIELISWLSRYPGAENTKIVYCTSQVMVSEMTRAKRGGAHAFLLKPFDRRMLAEKMAEIGILDAATVSREIAA
ncbi:MAG: response regulator [Nitratireductor sp.]|nr:response regulator [Nitratireductor sp.]